MLSKHARLLIASSSLILLILGTIITPLQTLAQTDPSLPVIAPAATGPSAGKPTDSVAGQVVVGLKQPDPQFDKQVEARGANVLAKIEPLKSFLIGVPVNAEDAFITAIKKNPNVQYAERNFIVSAVFDPNDTYWSYQWNMRIVKANSAWDTQLGKQTIVVAVVDTGVKYSHPDLSGRVINGYDFINNDPDAMDDHWHGTHVAGIVGAITSNGIGVAGLAQVSILAVKVLSASGSGTDWTVAQGITYSADNGAHVINLSLGCYCTSQLMEDATNYAYNTKGKLLVAAAGNDNTNTRLYPAAYNNVIAVSATNNNDKKASYSNWGDWIELSAPGGDTIGGPYGKTYVLSTYLNDNYAFAAGTSMASPHAAGVAALTLSQYPTLTNTQLRTHLASTADDLGNAGWDQYFGYGRVNALNAVQTVPQSTSHDVAVTAINAPLSVVKGDLVSVGVNVENQGAFSETFSVTLDDASAAVNIGTQSVTLAAGASTTLNFSWDTSTSTAGDHTLKATASTVSGETDTADNTKSVIVAVKEPVHDVAISPLTGAQSSANQGTIVTVDVAVRNTGSFAETFDVVLNDITIGATIGTKSVSLAAGEFRFVPFNWDTTNAILGNHNLEAKAGPVTGETNTADNTKSIVVSITSGATLQELGLGLDPSIAIDGQNVFVAWRDAIGALCSGGSCFNDVFFIKSANNGQTFGAKINVSNDVGSSLYPLVATAGTNIYIAWQSSPSFDPEDIYFARSIDGGLTFSSPINLSSNGGFSRYHMIAAEGSNVYVVWQDDTPGNTEIFFSRSIDYGATFGPIINLSSSSASSGSISMSLTGGAIYVAWIEGEAVPNGMIVRRSIDGGANFEERYIIAAKPGSRVIFDNNNVYAVWLEKVPKVKSTPSNWETFFARSTDGGVTFSQAVNLSNNPTESRYPDISVSGSNVYVAWQDGGGNYIKGVYDWSSDLFLVKSVDSGQTLQPAVKVTDAVYFTTGIPSFDLASTLGNVDFVWYTIDPNDPYATTYKVYLKR